MRDYYFYYSRGNHEIVCNIFIKLGIPPRVRGDDAVPLARELQKIFSLRLKPLKLINLTPAAISVIVDKALAKKSIA